MILVALIVMALYVIINYFIGRRIFKSINKIKKVNSKIYWIIFSLISSSFFIYEIFRNFLPHVVNKILAFIGSYYLAILFYIIIFFPIAFLITRIFKRKRIDFYIISLAIVIIISLVGTYLSNSPYVKKYDINIDKPLVNGSLNIALVSDIHLGEIISSNRLSKLVDEINALNPDIVLIAGDLIDMDLEPVIKDNMLPKLKNIKSKYGTYFSLGNHDFYTDRSDELTNILSSEGIHVLRDDSILINNAFYIIGRDDITKKRYGGDRTELSSIISGIDTTKPTIVIDHNPDYIEESKNNNIDLQVSGHTHKGQLFPLNYITNALFPVDYGYRALGNTNLVVTSGFGTWGPPIRTGSRSEITLITLHN